MTDYSLKPAVASELGEAKTWLSNNTGKDKQAKGGYVQEMFGTFFWIFLAGQIEFFGLGYGYQLGVSWIIVSNVFAGQFNSLDTIMRAVHGGDWLDSLIRLIVQALAGFIGTIAFTFFGFGKSEEEHAQSKREAGDEPPVQAGEANTFDYQWPTVHGADGDGSFNIMSWVMLFLTFLVYFFAKKQLAADKGESIPGWLGNILLFGLTFAVAGDGFLFAPNAMFFVGCDGIVGVLSTFWYVYLAYSVCAFLAAYVLHVLPSVCGLDFDKNNFLPKYEGLPIQGN